MTTQVWAVVPAAGRGTRFGGPVPKQYLLAAGEPVGEVRSGIEDVALAYVRLDALAAGDAAPLTAGDARLRPLPPAGGPTGTV